MVDYGTLNKVINAQNVKLKIGPTADSEEAEGSQQEWITMYNIRKRKSHPNNRINTRGGAVDFWSDPLWEITFEGLVSKDIFDKLEALCTLDSRHKLPVEDFTMVGENIGGQSGDDTKVQFNGVIPDLEDFAGADGQYAIIATLRIDNTTYPTGS